MWSDITMVTKVSLQALSMADTPPPLPAPLKEGDEGPPVGIYVLCGHENTDVSTGRETNTTHVSLIIAYPIITPISV